MLMNTFNQVKIVLLELHTVRLENYCTDVWALACPANPFDDPIYRQLLINGGIWSDVQVT